MRRPIIAANWKLNKSLKEAQDYARNFGSLANRFRDRDIVLAVPCPFIHAVSKLLEESRIETSAQEIYFEEKGAFTGTVSQRPWPKMLAQRGRWLDTRSAGSSSERLGDKCQAHARISRRGS